MSGFVHLHVHTHYSILDGLCKIPDLVSSAVAMEMPAMAITDHGNLFGAVEFQKTCGKNGVKPILGCEIGLVHDEDRPCHIVLLARNLVGYRNLTKLVSKAHLESSTDRPYVEISSLTELGDGLLALSGDIGGTIPQAILRGQMDRAEQLLDTYREVFGVDGFFLEIQRHQNLPEQDTVNAALIELSKRHDTPLVASADCHYVLPDEADAHTVLMCIGLDKRLDLSDLGGMPVRDLYLKSPDEMRTLFSDLPEAVENTLHVARLCDVEIPLDQVFLPQFQVPDGHSIESFFRELARDGLARRLDETRARVPDLDEAPYHEQLEVEIGVIEQMEYPGYFLIVWDFINFARENGIPVGPGRGSGAGSLVAYSLRITNVDPLRYGLLFERFLNPERVSMPDFDIDFCMNRRGEVIDYVTRRYGENNVGQIVTFGQLKARACIRDTSRVLNLPYSEADRLAKLIPGELGITLDKAYRQEPRLREAIAEDERYRRLFKLAQTLEGTNRNTGIHAAGIVIADSPLWDFVPVTRGVNGELVTQFAKDEVESAGLVKFDFLGLRNLTVIAEAVRLVNQDKGPDDELLDIDQISLDDPAVYRLLSTGETTGIFQMESSGFQELMRKLRPTVFEDIIAAGALYRPGPLASGMVDDFCDCKHGIKRPVYPHPSIEGILKETYGVIVYQEQVMQIAQVMAGYTLGGADLLRRAMGKKKHKVMAEQRTTFLTGAQAAGINIRLSGEVFDNMALFAGYGFNKSHATAYGMVTYQTAYLKAHHPVHFMAALMTNDADRTDRVVRLIHEAKGMGIQVLPPDVNASSQDFTVSEGQIRFGLGAVKGVGHGAIEAIEAAREDKRFRSLYDFCESVDSHRVNRRVVETLVKCGTFDSLADEKLDPGDLDAIGKWRGTLFSAVQPAFALGQKAQADRDAGQATLNLFGSDTGPVPVHYPDAEQWPDKVILNAEKECLGFFVSGHPLDRYENELSLYATHSTDSLETAGERTPVKIGGIIESIRERRSKSGTGRHAFAMLEDRFGRVEVLVFNRVFSECEDLLKSGEPVLIHGSVRIEGDEEPRERKVVCERAQLLTDARLESVERVIIELSSDELTRQKAEQLLKLLQAHDGGCLTHVRLTIPMIGEALFSLPANVKVAPTDELMLAIDRLLGRGRVFLA